MQYPLISEYIDAIRSAEDNFDKLSSLRPVLDSNGNPVMSVGNFAVVFKMKDVFNDRLFAVKCFIKEQEQRSEYYRLISEELNYVSSPYLLNVRYLERELFVYCESCDEEEFPVLVMEWVEGQPLDAYLKQHIDDTYDLQMLAYRFCKMGAWLLSQPFAHGDLKPDNILVREDGALVLVDYDGMYVSTMEGREACELGSPDFRHPLRDKESFDEHIDDFSIATIALSLKSIALSPQLYHQYGAADRLLFSANDYHDIGQSPALKAITALSSDSELSILLGVFLLSLAKKSLSLVSFRLLLLKEPEKPAIDVLSTKITNEEFDNAIEYECGTKYTADGLKLISVPRYAKCYKIKDGTRVIGDNAFMYCKSLNSIEIPDSVNIIGNFAFYCCTSLTSIAIPDSVTSIGNKAFWGCESLTSIEIPDSVKIIGGGLLNGCHKLHTIVLKTSMYYIQDSILFSKEKVILSCWSKYSSIIIPNGVTSIGNKAFSDCTSLTSIAMPDSVTSIGNEAFFGCI